MNLDDDRDFSKIMESVALPGGSRIRDLISSHSDPYPNAPIPPASMRGYDEDQDVMWFPESETLNWRSRTLEEIAEVIAAARVKLNVPTDYDAFYDVDVDDYDGISAHIWFGREETEEEEAARVDYIDARLQYWETNKESIKPVSFHWTDKGEGETL
jgi:hypothetical protein